MKRARVSVLLLIAAVLSLSCSAQDSLVTLNKDEFFAIVKTYHPVAKQAQLTVERADAEVLSARGAFDPTVNSIFQRKTFDGKLYYSYFNPQITVPTWYGLDLKAGVEEVLGDRSPTELTRGKTSYMGLKLNANTLLFDSRRATLRQAQSFRKQTEAERALVVNDLLYDALVAYWNWTQQYLVYRTLAETVQLNEERLKFVRIEYEQGARPAIDTTEALSQLQNFYLLENNALLAFQNAGLELSGYLWLENNAPLQWSDSIVPAPEELMRMSEIPALLPIIQSALLQHPKLNSISYKLEILELEKRLKSQYLLPKVGVNANMLNGGYQLPNELSAPFLENNYKLGVDVSLPLFLREARGQVRSAKLKIRETTLEQDWTALQVENKIRTYYNNIVQIKKQIEFSEQMLANNIKLFQGERLKFEAGESTLFLLNSRENKVLESIQKLLELRAKWQKSYSGLLWAAGTLI
ncbi:MAG: TolC family protein [Flavipsychrobacter sp.]|nr:TolC family protein [Flavipsychrobacter sp.]